MKLRSKSNEGLGSTNAGTAGPGAAPDNLWESAFIGYLDYALKKTDGSSLLVAQIQETRNGFSSLLREIESGSPDQYPQLERKLAVAMSDLKNTVKSNMDAFRLYVKREELLKDAQAADLDLNKLSAREASEQLTEFLRQHAAATGKDPDAIEPVQSLYDDNTVFLLKKVAQQTFDTQKQMIESFGRLAGSIQRERLLLEWPLRLLHLFIFLVVLAIGSDVISGLAPYFWLHLIMVALLWAAQEYWLAPAVTRWINWRQRYNLIRFATSSYRTKMQALCEIAMWKHSITQKIR